MDHKSWKGNKKNYVGNSDNQKAGTFINQSSHCSDTGKP